MILSTTKTNKELPETHGTPSSCLATWGLRPEKAMDKTEHCSCGGCPVPHSLGSSGEQQQQQGQSCSWG